MNDEKLRISSNVRAETKLKFRSATKSDFCAAVKSESSLCD